MTVKAFLRANALTLATMTGVIIGVCLGVGLRSLGSEEDPWSKRDAMNVAFIGKLFLRMLKCIIIPLIIPSLISAVGSLDLALSGKVGGRAVAYYMTTTVIAVALGIGLVYSIQPGVGHQDDGEGPKVEARNVTTADTLMDLVRNCFPPNIVQATVQQYRTGLVYEADGKVPFNESDRYTWNFKGEWSQGTNILGLVVFSIVTGVAIAVSGEQGKPLLDFFNSVSVVMMKLTTWIIYLAPVGVCFLIAGQILGMKDVAKTFEKLGWYFATVLIGLSVHGIVILPLIFGN